MEAFKPCISGDPFIVFTHIHVEATSFNLNSLTGIQNARIVFPQFLILIDLNGKQKELKVSIAGDSSITCTNMIIKSCCYLFC